MRLFAECDDSVRKLILRVLEKIACFLDIENAFEDIKQTIVLCINYLTSSDKVSSYLLRLIFFETFYCTSMRILIIFLKYPILAAEFLRNNGFEFIFQLSQNCDDDDAKLLILKLLAILSEVCLEFLLCKLLGFYHGRTNM